MNDHTHHTRTKRGRLTYQQVATVVDTIDQQSTDATMGVTISEDEEEMKEVPMTPVVPTEVVTMNPINTRQLLFGDVMVEPCMMVMLEFTSVSDRIRLLRISRLWLHMIRLPRLWQKYLLRLPGRYQPPERNHGIDRLPNWFFNCVTRLEVFPNQPSHVVSLERFRQVQYLSLEGYCWCDLSHFDAPLFRSALQSLRLIGLSCYCLAPQVMQCLLTSSVEPKPNELKPPPIHHWTQTLTHLRIQHLYRQPTLPTLLGIVRYTWPQLISFSIDLDAESTLLLKRKLTQTRVPLLRRVCHGMQCDLPDELGDAVFEYIQPDLNQLMTFKLRVKVSSRGDDDRDIHIPTYQQVFRFPSGLTDLNLMISIPRVYPYFVYLPHLQKLSLSLARNSPLMTSHQLFTIIGHHNLPQLHSLRIELIEGDEMKVAVWKEQHDQVIRMMTAMVNLTSLDIDLVVCDVIQDWLQSIHHFPNLNTLKLRWLNVCLEAVGLYESIIMSPQLTDVTLTTTSHTWPRLSDIILTWSRHATTSVNLNSASLRLAPIRRLEFNIRSEPALLPSLSDHGHPQAPFDFTSQLQCLTQLTDLTIDGQQYSEMLRPLADLPQLRCLTLRGQPPLFGLMEILIYWTQPPPLKRFPRLTTLRLIAAPFVDWSSSCSHLSSSSLIQLLSRIPHLHTLQIEVSNEPSERVLKTTQSFLHQLNYLGRQPQLELLVNVGRIGRFHMELVGLDE